MCLVLFGICIFLLLMSSMLPPAFVLGLLTSKNKYRGHLRTLAVICVVSFAALLLVDSLIYWGLRWAENNVSDDHFVLDWHPFPDIVMFSLNWHLPAMLVVMVGMLMLAKNSKKKAHLWIAVAVAALSVCGFVVLGHHVFSHGLGHDLRSVVWWL